MPYLLAKLWGQVLELVKFCFCLITAFPACLPPSFFHLCRKIFVPRCGAAPARAIGPTWQQVGWKMAPCKSGIEPGHRRDAHLWAFLPQKWVSGAVVCSSPAPQQHSKGCGEASHSWKKKKQPKPQTREERDKSNNQRGGKRSEPCCRRGWVCAAWQGERVPAGKTGWVGGGPSKGHCGNPPLLLFPLTFSWWPSRWQLRQPWGRVSGAGAVAWRCWPPHGDS